MMQYDKNIGGREGSGLTQESMGGKESDEVI